MKKIIIGILLAVTLLTTTAYAAGAFNFKQSPDVLYLDGVKVDTSNPKIGSMFIETVNSRNYVPLRLMCESMGWKVDWKPGRINEIYVTTSKEKVDGIRLGKVTYVKDNIAHIVVNNYGYTIVSFKGNFDLKKDYSYAVRNISRDTMQIINASGQDVTVLSTLDIK